MTQDRRKNPAINSHNITNQDLTNQNIKDYLNTIRMVMVNTTLPANIGSAARAMYTMGLESLTVVNPKHPIDEDSIAHAAGAKSVLDSCQIVDTIEAAISDCHLVFAASSRQRYIPKPVVTPIEAAKLITDTHSANLKVAVLFGREDRGLTNEELALADYHIQIDANPQYPVLNVASAIQVISSFFYSYFLQHCQQQQHIYSTSKLTASNADKHTLVDTEENTINIFLRQVWDSAAITQQQKINLQHRIIKLMHQLDLIDTTEQDQLRSLPTRLSRLLSRLQLDEKEYELISSIIAKVMLRI